MNELFYFILGAAFGVCAVNAYNAFALWRLAKRERKDGDDD